MSQTKKKRGIDILSLMLLTLLGIFVIGGVLVLVDSLRGEPVPVRQFQYSRQPVIGDEKASIQIMEFGDFKCPTCKAFHDNVYPKLKKEYIDTGKVKMYFNNLAFLGPDSITAALAGEAIYKQNKEAFWKFYDLMYQRQQDEQKVWATESFLIDLVEKEFPEIDAKQFAADLKNKKYQNEVTQDAKEAEKYGITSVPDIYINGKQVANPTNYQEVKQAIEKELKEK
jgi:protein-disulfide isomerase